MKKKDIVKLLQDYKQGTLSEEEAAAKIAEVPFEEMQFAEIRKTIWFCLACRRGRHRMIWWENCGRQVSW